MRIERSGLGAFGATCTTLTPDQVYQYALDAGFPCDVAAQMVAIAHKESGFQTCAHNAVPPDDSYGLWQINMLGSLLQTRLKQFGISTAAALYDPATNAAAAYSLWGGNPNNLNVAWAINDNGPNQSRYQAYLPTAQAMATAAGCAALGGSVDISSTSSSDNENTTSDSSVVSGAGIDLTDPTTLIVLGIGGFVLLKLFN